MELFDKYGKKINLQEVNDTGWENLDGTKLQGRILNGIATLVFENFDFNGEVGGYLLIHTLPEKYKPSKIIYFSFFTNTKTPSAYMCALNASGEIRTYCLKESNNVVGSVTYPVL